MEEITVQTTGSFMLIESTSRREIGPNAPTKVPYTGFIRERIRIGQLKVVDPTPVPNKRSR